VRQERLNPPPCKVCGFYPCTCVTDNQFKQALEDLEKEALEMEDAEREDTQTALKVLWTIFHKVQEKNKS